MSIRFSIRAASSEALDEDVVIDAHHVDTTGEWFAHPIRSHKLRLGHDLHLLAHVALGFMVHKGQRDELMLAFQHDDPQMSHGLELVVLQAPDAYPDLLPDAVTLAQAAEGIEAVECERLLIPPGGNASVTLLRGTKLKIRELRMEAESHG